MLVLTRKAQQQIRVGENVIITIVRIKGNAVRVGIDAPKNVRVVRAELPKLSDEVEIVDMTPGKLVHTTEKRVAVPADAVRSSSLDVQLFCDEPGEGDTQLDGIVARRAFPKHVMPGAGGLASRVALRASRKTESAASAEGDVASPIGFGAAVCLRS